MRLAAVAQHGALSPPLSTFFGWATCAFGVSQTDRVAYLYMPKAGSTTIRSVLEKTYGLRPHALFPGGLHPDDTFIAFPPTAAPRSVLLRLYGEKFAPDRTVFGGLRSTQPIQSIDGFFKFTFVTDPSDHLVRGVCELLSWRLRSVRRKLATEDLCMHAMSTGRVSFELRVAFARAVSDVYSALHGRHSRSLNVHLAPQAWLLRAAAACGQRLDFVARLGSEGWDDLRQYMADAGYRPVGPLEAERKNQKSFGSLTALVFRDASIATVHKACAMLRTEYETLGFPPRKDSICADPRSSVDSLLRTWTGAGSSLAARIFMLVSSSTGAL